MTSFDIYPFAGALPIHFGMARTDVIKTLGNPDCPDSRSDSWGPKLEINIGYDENGNVSHIGLSPGNFELKFSGQVIWTPTEHADPNPIFLLFDPEPLEHVGFLVFTKLGIKTTGFHDDDPDDVAVALYPKEGWKFLERAKKPNLAKYGK